MAGFHLVRDGRQVEARVAAAQARFRSHGFSRFTPIRTPEYVGFHVDYIHGGPETLVQRGDDFIAAAGTLTYKGRIGRPALEALLDSFALPFDAWSDLDGQFALLVQKAGRTSLITDYFAAFQIFHDPDWRTVSTSFLATAEALPRLRWDDQGVYEFGLNIFPLGEDTVFEEVRRLGPNLQVALGQRPGFHRVVKLLPSAPEALPLPQRIDRAAERLLEIAAPFVAQFGDRAQTPLSGGLDSRLALALLRRAGVRPHVYVYGGEDDDDVAIARAIGRAEGFNVECVNKRNHAQITPDDFSAIVERNWAETDALTTDGGLFDNGGNAAARHARQANGQLAVSGGCGEVLRNFFYLPDIKMRARAVALAFYARFVGGDLTERFDRRRFVAAIEAKLAEALYAPVDRKLDRTEVEQIYPRVRCRAFFGREISLVARHGAYFMPFLYRSIVDEGLRLPMNLKAAGRFEALLLNHLDPRLASHMSTYGHAFNQPPSRAHRMTERATVIRPAWLRQRSYTIRRRLGALYDDHGGILEPAFLGRVIDLHFPHMSAFFRPAEVADHGLYRRIATLELLGQKMANRLAG